MYLTQRQAVVRSIQQGQNRFLPLKQSVSTAERWHTLTLPEAHGHAIAAFLDLRLWQSGGGRQLRHLERSKAPLLDDAAPIERAGNQRIPWPRFVRAEQCGRVSPKCSVPVDVTSSRSSYTASPTDPPPSE